MTSRSAAENQEHRLNEILLEYVETCESGQSPDRQAILAANPELRADLMLFFEGRDQLERLGGFVRGNADVEQADFHERPVVPSADSENGRLGDFRILREIGRGGMGIVYEAEQISLSRRVAIKILPFAAALDPRQLQRFKNEASAAAHLRHENIVAVHAVGCERGVHFYAMQYIEGKSLSALIAELRQTSPPIVPASTMKLGKLLTEKTSNRVAELDWIAGLGRQAALALEHAHQTGVIHRDIKPGNLLIDTRRQLWITDFGLAQIANDSGLTMTGEMLGTLRYASPEQTQGRKGLVDHRTDIYSLGATLYELLTLRPPFDGADRHELLRQISETDPPSLRSIVSSIPESLEIIVLKALRKDPADRYCSGQEFADDLQRYLDRQPIRARPPGLAERFWGWTRRHPVSLMAGVISLSLLTAASILIVILVGAERERTQIEQRKTQLAYQAEQSRAEEAESRFRLARRAVDELLHISEDELADRPEMAVLRKRLLRSALTFYQEFLAERGDPKTQTELLETTSRVEQILADLEILRSATHFYLLLQPAVLRDLGITTQQRPAITELTERVGKEWLESFRDIGLTSAAERARRTLAQARANDAELNSLLTQAQQVRLRQIGLQSDGAAAFRDPELAAELNLSSIQRERIRVIEDDATFGWMRGRHPTRDQDHLRDAESPFRSVNERIREVLTNDQIQKWQELTGQPLKEPLLPFGSPPVTKSSSLSDQ